MSSYVTKGMGDIEEYACQGAKKMENGSEGIRHMGYYNMSSHFYDRPSFFVD